MTPAQVWMVALMFGFSVTSYFDRTILSVAAPMMMKEFSLSPTSMGIVFTSFQLTYTLLMTPGGRLSDRIGPWKVLGIGGFGAGLLTALLPLGGTPGLGAWIGIIPALAMLRAGFGTFTAPLYPSLGNMTSIALPPLLHTRVFGIVNGGSGLGGSISPMLFSMMIGRFGWRASFVIAGVAAMILAGLWMSTVPSHRDKKHATLERASWGELLGNSNIRWLIVGYAAVDYFQYIFFFWLYYYLGEVRKLPAAETASYATMPFVAGAIMMPLGGWLADRLSKTYGMKTGLRAVSMTSLLLASVCLIAAMNASDINWLVGLLSLALGFASSADVPFWSAVVNLAGKQAGAAGGLMNTGGNVGGSLAPILTPIVAAQFGWSAGLYLAAAVAVVGFLAWLGIDPEPKDA